MVLYPQSASPFNTLIARQLAATFSIQAFELPKKRPTRSSSAGVRNRHTHSKSLRAEIDQLPELNIGAIRFKYELPAVNSILSKFLMQFNRHVDAAIKGDGQGAVYLQHALANLIKATKTLGATPIGDFAKTLLPELSKLTSQLAAKAPEQQSEHGDDLTHLLNTALDYADQFWIANEESKLSRYEPALQKSGQIKAIPLKDKRAWYDVFDMPRDAESALRAGGHVLVVDDNADSGSTMDIIARSLENYHNITDVTFFALLYMKPKGKRGF